MVTFYYVIIFCKFAEFFSEGQKVNSSMLCGLLGSAPAIAKSAIQLAELELKYEVVNLYLWLRYGSRFYHEYLKVIIVHK